MTFGTMKKEEYENNSIELNYCSAERFMQFQVGLNVGYKGVVHRKHVYRKG